MQFAACWSIPVCLLTGNSGGPLVDTAGRVVRCITDCSGPRCVSVSACNSNGNYTRWLNLLVMLQIGVCTATFTRQGTGRSSGVNLACEFYRFLHAKQA